MSITAEAPGPAPAGVLAETLAVVRSLAETLWSARSDAELVEVVGRVQQLTSALAAVEAGAVAKADARDLGPATAALRLDRGLADPHRRAAPRPRQAHGGPGQSPDRTPGPDPARAGRRHRLTRAGRSDRRRRRGPAVR